MNEKTTFFTQEQLRKANTLARRRGYNRSLSDEQIKTLTDSFYPVVFSMPHEHAAGVKVKPHMRCLIYLGKDFAYIDCDAEIFNQLGTKDLNKGE